MRERVKFVSGTFFPQDGGAEEQKASRRGSRARLGVCVWGGRRSLTAVSSSQTAPPGLVLRVPAEAATASVDATIADFMMLGKKCGVRTVHYHFQILSYPSQQKTGVSVLWRSIVLETA